MCVRRAPGRVERYQITEVEAYDGPDDRASHASRGRTERNAPMFGPPGHWYVYLCYGLHWMLNVVTGPVGYPAAVLIRGVVGHDGPAKLTKALGVDRRFNDRSAASRTGLWLEAGETVPDRLVRRLPRVGVDYAGEWAGRPYRLVVASDADVRSGNQFVSE